VFRPERWERLEFEADRQASTVSDVVETIVARALEHTNDVNGIAQQVRDALVAREAREKNG
jgi:hypothetical protein